MASEGAAEGNGDYAGGGSGKGRMIFKAAFRLPLDPMSVAAAACQYKARSWTFRRSSRITVSYHLSASKALQLSPGHHRQDLPA